MIPIRRTGNTLALLLATIVVGACTGGDITDSDPNCSSGLGASGCSPAIQAQPNVTGGSPAPAAAPPAAPDAGATPPAPPTPPPPPPPSPVPDAGMPPTVDAGMGMTSAPDAAATPVDAGTVDTGAGSSSATDVPAIAHCMTVADWDPMWAEFEEDVLRLTNEARARGADCGEEGMLGATGPLTMNPILRCSSRLHSEDMGENEYFDHTNQEMDDPFDRMIAAGYMGMAMGENIAKGQQTPDDVVEGWLESDGHCANIMSPAFTEIGIGYWEGMAESRFFNGNKLWTQNFGTPARMRPRR